MKFDVPRTALAAAVAGALTTTSAFADQLRKDGSTVEIDKYTHVEKEVSYDGDIEITGKIKAEALGMSVVETVQRTDGNSSLTTRSEHETNASIDDDALERSEGNIGVNSAAGDGNAQANSASVAAADADFVFGHGDAETFAKQTSTQHEIVQEGGSREAMIDGYALGNSSGNIGANVVAGVGNAQQNNIALTSGADSLGESTAVTDQQANSNSIQNYPFSSPRNRASMGDDALKQARGNIGANVAAGDGNLQANSLALTHVGE